jgi:ribonuclease-3 family protein
MSDDILKKYSPLTLAFLGDGVYELMVREKLVSDANRPVSALHKMAVARVRAAYQAEAADAIMDTFTETEADVYRRGKNVSGLHIPKSSSSSEYHRATGLEALFGYLYLKNDKDRLRELFELIINR